MANDNKLVRRGLLTILSEGERKTIAFMNKLKEKRQKRDYYLQNPHTITPHEIAAYREDPSIRPESLTLQTDIQNETRKLSIITRNLDKRLELLIADLQIILKSTALKPWASQRTVMLSNVSILLEKLNQVRFGPDYRNKRVFIKHESRRRYYWLDTNAKLEKPTNRDFFRPEFALSGIKSYWIHLGGRDKQKVNVRIILLEALKLEDAHKIEILPRSATKAASIGQIYDRIQKARINPQSFQMQKR